LPRARVARDLDEPLVCDTAQNDRLDVNPESQREFGRMIANPGAQAVENSVLVACCDELAATLVENVSELQRHT
jgi:hypothetical protein